MFPLLFCQTIPINILLLSLIFVKFMSIFLFYGMINGTFIPFNNHSTFHSFSINQKALHYYFLFNLMYSIIDCCYFKIIIARAFGLFTIMMPALFHQLNLCRSGIVEYPFHIAIAIHYLCN